MVAAVLVTLGANLNIHAHRRLTGMATARTMAAFALNVCQVLQFLRHRRIIRARQYARESPAELFLNSVEVPIARSGRRFIVAERMANEATFTVVRTENTVHPKFGHRRMAGLLPERDHVRITERVRRAVTNIATQRCARPAHIGSGRVGDRLTGGVIADDVDPFNIRPQLGNKFIGVRQQGP